MQNSQPSDIDETNAARMDQLDADDANSLIEVIDLTLPDAHVCISLLDSDSDAVNDEVAVDAEQVHPTDSEA